MTRTTFLGCIAGAALAQEHGGHKGDHQKHSAGDHMHRRFDNPEQWSKSFDDPARDKWQMLDRVIASLGLKPGQSVADIGAGTGYLTIRLAKSAARPKVFAVDIEQSMVEHLTKRAAAEGLKNVVAVKAGEDSPNLPQPVDLIVILDTYHHIPKRVSYFRQLAASLKPGGRLAIIDWRPEGPMGPPAEFRFSVEKIAGELGEAGYRKVAQHDYLPNQNFVVFVPAKR